MTTHTKNEYRNIGANSSQIEQSNSRPKSTNTFSFMVNFNQESQNILFMVEELNKLNTFKYAVISAFQMNLRFDQILVYYQCIVEGYAETEEEALKVSDDSTICEVLDWHRNNELDFKIIKFIIKLNISDDKFVLSDGLIEFDEQTARAVLQLSDYAAAKAEDAAVQLRLRLNSEILYSEIYDINKCLDGDHRVDNEELCAETPQFDAGPKRPKDKVIKGVETPTDEEINGISYIEKYGIISYSKKYDIEQEILETYGNIMRNIKPGNGISDEMKLRRATGMKLPAQYDEEIKLKPADDDTLEVTKNEEVNGHERPIFDDQNTVAAKLELEEVLKKCVDENVLYNETIGNYIINNQNKNNEIDIFIYKKMILLCFIAYSIDQSDIKDPTNLYLGTVLAVVVILTGIFGYYQESKSADLMGSLSKMKQKNAIVTRDNGDEYNLISINCLSENLGINETTATHDSNEININDKSCQHLNISGKFSKVINIICSANDANLQVCNVINIIRITISNEFTLEFDGYIQYIMICVLNIMSNSISMVLSNDTIIYISLKQLNKLEMSLNCYNNECNNIFDYSTKTEIYIVHTNNFISHYIYNQLILDKSLQPSRVRLLDEQQAGSYIEIDELDKILNDLLPVKLWGNYLLTNKNEIILYAMDHHKLQASLNASLCSHLYRIFNENDGNILKLLVMSGGNKLLRKISFNNSCSSHINSALAQQPNSIKTETINVADIKLINNEYKYDEEQYNSDYYYVNKSMNKLFTNEIKGKRAKYILIELLNTKSSILTFENTENINYVSNYNGIQILNIINKSTLENGIDKLNNNRSNREVDALIDICDRQSCEDIDFVNKFNASNPIFGIIFIDENNNDNNNIKLLAKSIECIIKKYIERLLVIAKLNELQESFKELMVQYLSSDLCKITESMDRNDIEYDMYEINELKNIFEHDVQYAYEPEEYYNLALSLRPDRPSIYYNLALNPNNNIYRIDSFSEDEYDGDTITLNSIANDTNDDNNINNTTEYYQLNKILIQLKILSQTNKTFVVGMIAVSILLGCYTINFGIVITLSSILCIITLMNIFYYSLYIKELCVLYESGAVFLPQHIRLYINEKCVPDRILKLCEQQEMAKRNQLQQQQQHKYHSQRREMAKCSQSVATPKTSSNMYINNLNDNQIIKHIIDIDMEPQLICIGLNKIIITFNTDYNRLLLITSSTDNSVLAIQLLICPDNSKILMFGTEFRGVLGTGYSVILVILNINIINENKGDKKINELLEIEDIGSDNFDNFSDEFSGSSLSRVALELYQQILNKLNDELTDNELKLDSGNTIKIFEMHGHNSDKNKILIARSGGAKATYNDSLLITTIVYNNDNKILYCIGVGNTIKIMSNGEILDIYGNLICNRLELIGNNYLFGLTNNGHGNLMLFKLLNKGNELDFKNDECILKVKQLQSKLNGTNYDLCMILNDNIYMINNKNGNTSYGYNERKELIFPMSNGIDREYNSNVKYFNSMYDKLINIEFIMHKNINNDCCTYLRYNEFGTIIAIETYNLMSLKWVTHALPTMKDDSIESIYGFHLALKLCNKLITEIKKLDDKYLLESKAALTTCRAAANSTDIGLKLFENIIIDKNNKLILDKLVIKNRINELRLVQIHNKLSQLSALMEFKLNGTASISCFLSLQDNKLEIVVNKCIATCDWNAATLLYSELLSLECNRNNFNYLYKYAYILCNLKLFKECIEYYELAIKINDTSASGFICVITENDVIYEKELEIKSDKTRNYKLYDDENKEIIFIVSWKELRENISKYVVRNIGISEQPIIEPIINECNKILLTIAENPQEPIFSHYMFEISVTLINYSQSNSIKFELKLMSSFRKILKMEQSYELHQDIDQIIRQRLRIRYKIDKLIQIQLWNNEEIIALYCRVIIILSIFIIRNGLNELISSCNKTHNNICVRNINELLDRKILTVSLIFLPDCSGLRMNLNFQNNNCIFIGIYLLFDSIFVENVNKCKGYNCSSVLYSKNEYINKLYGTNHDKIIAIKLYTDFMSNTYKLNENIIASLNIYGDELGELYSYIDYITSIGPKNDTIDMTLLPIQFNAPILNLYFIYSSWYCCYMDI